MINLRALTRWSMQIITFVLMILTCGVCVKAETENEKLDENPYIITDNSVVQLDYAYDWNASFLYNNRIYVPFKETANLMLYSVEGNELCDLRMSKSAFIHDNTILDIDGYKFGYFVGADPFDYSVVSYVSKELQWCYGAPISFFTTTFHSVGEKMDYRIMGDTPHEIVSQVVDKFPITEYDNEDSFSYYAFYDVNTNCVYTVYECMNDTVSDRKSTQDGPCSKAIGVNLSTGETAVYYSIYSDVAPDLVHDTAISRQGSEFYPFPSVGYIEPYVDFEVEYNGNSFYFGNQAIKISQEDSSESFVYVPLEELCKVLNYSYKFENERIDICYVGNNTDISDWAKTTVGRALVNYQLDKTNLYGLQYPINRIDMATILFDLLGQKGTNANSIFKDTDSYKIATLYELGIISGNNDNSADKSLLYYNPFDYLTREEFAVVISNIMNFLKMDCDSQPAVFTDDEDFADWSKEAIYKVASAGIMRGYPEGEFKPSNNISKEECVVALLTLMNKQQNNVTVQSSDD